MIDLEIYSKEVRESVFLSCGYDNSFTRIVQSLQDGKKYLLLKDELYSMDEKGNAISKRKEITEKFNNGVFLFVGSLGNGICYWDVREEIFPNEYKKVGQIYLDNTLQVLSELPVLKEYLQTEQRRCKAKEFTVKNREVA